MGEMAFYLFLAYAISCMGQGYYDFWIKPILRMTLEKAIKSAEGGGGNGKTNRGL
jgi:hypothetical protein